MNITERSSKPEIITAAMELTDDQAQRIEELETQQRWLFLGLGLLACVVVF
jgi:hypothetical protein